MVNAIARMGDTLKVNGTESDRPVCFAVDRIDTTFTVVATGFRPDLSRLSELRLSLDPMVEATPALAPLIDPNQQSRGTVRPQGVLELTQPEKDFYIVGMKSYGRAPTFLMTTGDEQVRSLVAKLAGDPVAAREVRLKLSETGVCKVSSGPSASACCARAPSESGCCSGAPKADASGCCADEESARAEGKPGCGCSTKIASELMA